MKRIITILAVLLLAGASETDAGEKCKDKDCHPKKVCFNVLCSYRKAEGDRGFASCHAAATFVKTVTWDGREIPDRSEHPFNPDFEVECDGELIYNNSSHRYTDSQGTRIQAIAGPYPGIILPQGALRDTRQYVPSSLELGDQFLGGYCYVYTGPQPLPQPQ